ncbi:MAG: hypothetical protein K9I94_07310 [Bacteroidales bacterium]|nr:hypothetical protein [Bacteroidales bacterium]
MSETFKPLKIRHLVIYFIVIPMVGDTVNTASRLEQLTKSYSTDIIISEKTRYGLDHQFTIEPLSKTTLAGKKEAIMVYTVK